MNIVHMMGRATADPEMRTSQAGNLMAKFSLAVDKKLTRQQREEFVRDNRSTADFFKVVAWGGTAEILERYLKKGARIAVLGQMINNNYEKEGERVYFTELHAERIHIIDLPHRERTSHTDSSGSGDAENSRDATDDFDQCDVGSSLDEGSFNSNLHMEAEM